VDTYNTLKSGVPNFCAVAAGLIELGYIPLGVRLDSGDLAYLSKETRKMYKAVGEKLNMPQFNQLQVRLPYLEQLLWGVWCGVV